MWKWFTANDSNWKWFTGTDSLQMIQTLKFSTANEKDSLQMIPCKWFTHENSSLWMIQTWQWFTANENDSL